MTHIVLTGFMGTGKTTVGRAVAQRLGLPFVDMDSEIEKCAGKSIPRIFAEDGEAAFREMESEFCEELNHRTSSVIATGGGALLDATNRAIVMSEGVVICLSCAVDEILERVGSKDDRPLLQVADPRAEVERLLSRRREVYQTIPWQIDTTALSVAEVAERVIALADNISLNVRFPGGMYAIHIGRGTLRYTGYVLLAAGAPEGSCVAVVSNPVVAPLYADVVLKALDVAGFQAFLCEIPDGEQHKTLDTVALLYEQFLAEHLDRSGTVLSLGGGVTGDIAGFAAATFMRGLRFVQVPTTLLAMVDASVGAKTGVDLPQGKNLVGAFKQPAMVLIDPSVLETLAVEDVRAGMAEVLKHGVIADPQLFAELEDGPHYSAPRAASTVPFSSDLLARALKVKIDVVEADPFEQGWRAVLNLGHTVGHALERLGDFQMRHGEAVAIGMLAAARISVALGHADRGLVDRITEALRAWGLPRRCPPFEAEAIWQAMAHDKKHRGRALRWILPVDIGEAMIDDDVHPKVVKSILTQIGARG